MHPFGHAIRHLGTATAKKHLADKGLCINIDIGANPCHPEAGHTTLPINVSHECGVHDASRFAQALRTGTLKDHTYCHCVYPTTCTACESGIKLIRDVAYYLNPADMAADVARGNTLVVLYWDLPHLLHAESPVTACVGDGPAECTIKGLEDDMYEVTWLDHPDSQGNAKQLRYTHRIFDPQAVGHHTMIFDLGGYRCAIFEPPTHPAVLVENVPEAPSAPVGSAPVPNAEQQELTELRARIAALEAAPAAATAPVDWINSPKMRRVALSVINTDQTSMERALLNAASEAAPEGTPVIEIVATVRAFIRELIADSARHLREISPIDASESRAHHTRIRETWTRYRPFARARDAVVRTATAAAHVVGRNAGKIALSIVAARVLKPSAPQSPPERFVRNVLRDRRRDSQRELAYDAASKIAVMTTALFGSRR